MKFKIIVLSAILLLGMSGCKKDNVQEVYSYGFHSFQSNLISDLAVIENYLNGKGLIISNKIIEAKSSSDADQEAIDLFNQNVAKISQDELAALVRGTTTFKYGLVKALPEGSTESSYLREKVYTFNQ